MKVTREEARYLARLVGMTTRAYDVAHRADTVVTDALYLKLSKKAGLLGSEQIKELKTTWKIVNPFEGSK
jgi:hypothetical protein